MRAKAYLEQIEKLDRMIKNKLSEVAKWEEVAASITAFSEGERVQSSGSLQKMADALDRCVDLRDEIKNCFAQKDAIIAVIEQLKPDEYDLLYKVYAQYLTLKEAAYKCGISYSNATTIHGRALKNVQRILDKRGKNE
jgi:DNA-directed RNA polymerase specialized sigma subunit